MQLSLVEQLSGTWSSSRVVFDLDSVCKRRLAKSWDLS